MTNLEQRTFRLEVELRQAVQLIRDLQVGLGTVAQNQWAGPTSGGGGGGTSGAFFCFPTSLAAATGTWPTITPASQSLAVYQVVSGALTSVSASATVYNFYKAAATASRIASCVANGDGTYSLTAQSCA